jgi:hypothetical protein
MSTFFFSHFAGKSHAADLFYLFSLNVLGRKFREKVSLQKSIIWSADLMLMGSAHSGMVKEKDRAFQETYSMLQNVVDLVSSFKDARIELRGDIFVVATNCNEKGQPYLAQTSKASCISFLMDTIFSESR